MKKVALSTQFTWFMNGLSAAMEPLDGVLPQMLPLLITLMLFYLIKKRKWTPVQCIGLLLVVGIIGGALNIFAA